MDLKDQFEYEEAQIALEQRQVDIDKRRLELKRRREDMFHRTEIDLTEDSDEETEVRRVLVKQEIKREEPPTNSTLLQQADATTVRSPQQDAATDTTKSMANGKHGKLLLRWAVTKAKTAGATTVAPATLTVTPMSTNPTIPPVVEPYCFVNIAPALMQGRETPFSNNAVFAPDPTVQTIAKPAEVSQPATRERSMEQSSSGERDSAQSMSTYVTIPTTTPTFASRRRNRRAKPPCGIVHDYWILLKRYFRDDAGLEMRQASAFEKLTHLYSLRLGKGPSADTPAILHQRFDKIVEELDGGGAEAWPLLPHKLKWISSFSLVWWPACKSIPRQAERERLLDKVIRDIKEHKYNEEEYHKIASTGRLTS